MNSSYCFFDFGTQISILVTVYRINPFDNGSKIIWSTLIAFFELRINRLDA
ncbi:hypothetical protein CLV48_101968 [Cecembia rubra]|uniref:Uncharacterized protein n=1 Tax=Cecembia rubra TaxID=1485585 RepID=A0A2P8EEX7_9BACT|nr:hypothetical protein CLV48_101968 [Cecembia rubra]